MIIELVVQFFLAGCRRAAVYPRPYRAIARQVLYEAPEELFS